MSRKFSFMDTISAQTIPLSSLPAHWATRMHKQWPTEKNTFIHCSIRDLLFWLRDMPYERPEGDNSVRNCITQWRGTCSAKHLAAHELLTAMDLSPTFWMANYQLDFSLPFFSDTLRALAMDQVVYDVHNFLTCDFGNGPITIDITFPQNLTALGLPVTATWNGTEHFKLCCTPEQSIEVNVEDQPNEQKNRWLNALNRPTARNVREKAILDISMLCKHN